jgi:PPOX class probable F420-dependent enzyme
MRLDAIEARNRFARSQVLRLATADGLGRPHLVPCTFAVDAAWRVAIGIDNKPKSSIFLRRLENIEVNPRVSMLVDHYDDHWEQLWWVRADGVATIERAGALYDQHWDELRSKYRQYGGQRFDGPVILVEVESWTGWAFGSVGP